MPNRVRRTEKLEAGDIFFFYRPRVDTAEVRGPADVQRFYMVLAAKWPTTIYRLFVIGKKKLPEPARTQQPERRHWALCTLVTPDPDDVRRELQGFAYTTQTRGERFVPTATPIGEGRYQLVWHGDHAELAYALELPRTAGRAQQEFEVRDQASTILAVKNPDLARPGFPSPAKPPAYPQTLRRRFGKRRWVEVDDPALLDYEGVQLLLLGAHAEDVEEELGVRIDTEDETLRSAEICRELRLACERARVRPLLEGEFPWQEDVLVP